jgi:hypothetical protein
LDKSTEHIEKMIKPYRELAKFTEPMREVQGRLFEQAKEWQKVIEPTLEAQRKLTETLMNFQKSFEKINRIYASIPRFENTFLEHLEAFEKIGERLKENSKNTPEYLLLIAQHGWFIDLESASNLPLEVVNCIQNKRIDLADKLLVDYYESNIDNIFERLINRHDNRKEILKSVKSSFQSGDYNLLIPAALTQVDGICFDFTKKKFFIKEKRNNKYQFLPEVIAEIENSAGNFLSLYLSPLQYQIPIIAREQEIGNFPCKLNRHEILHGVSTDYGTEVNSLKVISLLKYVSDLLTELDSKTLDSTKNKVNSVDDVKNEDGI